MMFALVAISRKGKDSIILDCFSDEDHTGVWENEFDAVDSHNLSDLGISVPETNGIFMLECIPIYPSEYLPDGTPNDTGPDWQCKWRMATLNEVKSFMRGKHIHKTVRIKEKVESDFIDEHTYNEYQNRKESRNMNPNSDETDIIDALNKS